MKRFKDICVTAERPEVPASYWRSKYLSNKKRMIILGYTMF
jgi:hypothetical protein